MMKTHVVGVFSPAGELVGRVALPRYAPVLDIGSDYVLFMERDTLDVEHLRLHTLERGGS
ncbi:MAG: hypothetical protein WEF86_02365 [Gemmatimonadota bacterium]